MVNQSNPFLLYFLGLALIFIILRIVNWYQQGKKFKRDGQRVKKLANPPEKLNIFVTHDSPKNPYEASVIKNTFKLERDPHNATLYCDRGAAYLMLQNFDNALLDFNRAIDLKPDYADAWSNRGLVHYTEKKYEAALADYSQAIKILDTDGVYFLNRGQAYRQLGNYEQALADLDRTLELIPNLSDVKKERGLVYYAMGKKEQALVELMEYREMVGYFMTDAEAIKALMELEKEN